MPNTDKIQWPQGKPQFETQWRAIAEALGGNGVVASGDLEVTATANALEIQVAAGDVFYGGTSYSHDSASTLTLSSGDSADDRWDTVYFDTSTSSAGVREGTPAANPEPPDISGSEILLATVYVAASASDVSDSEILNWRAHSTDADSTYLKDSNGNYSSETVEGAFTEVLSEAGGPLLGPLDLSSFSGSAPFDLGTNPATFGAVVDGVVDSNSAVGTEHSYFLGIDGNNFAEITAESDGSGGIQNAKIQLHQLTEVDGDVQTSSGTTIWDSTNGWVPNEQVQALANFTSDEAFSGYPLSIGSDVDAHLSGNDLLDADAGNKVYDQANGYVPRAQVDRKKVNNSVSSSTTTSGEEIIFADSSGGAITITLASSDVNAGQSITVVDIAGSASTNNITIDTENTETIDGGSSVAISTDYGAKRLESDGSNWVTAGGGSSGGDSGSGVTQNTILPSTSGTVNAGESGILHTTNLADGETLNINQAHLLLADGQPAPSNCDLIIATLDNTGTATKQTGIITGDGSTVYDDETGNPVASYTNSSGAGQTVALLVDNGNFNSGTGSAQTVSVGAVGEVE